MEIIFNWLFNLAILTNAVMVYLNINKVWSHKHETVVAESISVGARSIGITIALTFILHFILKKDYGPLVSYIIFLISDIVFFLIGIGFWIKKRKSSGFWQKVMRALRLESSRLRTLPQVFIKPQGEKQLLKVLHYLTWLDDKLDERKRAYIETFTNNCDVNTKDILIQKPVETGIKLFQYLCDELREYLKLKPPQEQIELLGDLVKVLIAVDQVITPESELIYDEILAIIETYFSQQPAKRYSIVIHPKTIEQENIILDKLPYAKVEYILGDLAIIAGIFHTQIYAQVVGEFYRELGWFTVVYEQPKVIFCSKL